MRTKNLYLLVLLFLPNLVWAQFTLSGTVVAADDNQGLPGANITNAQDSLLAVTDEEGGFQVILNSPTELVVNFVGYSSQRVRFSQGETNIRIVLEPENTLLGEVTVMAYEADRPLREVAGGVGLIQPQDIQQFDETSLVPVMNQVPGVRMEQRATGSYRISIRGSALRAPFDVRNVKVYWNNIPITEPGGNTPFNLFDNSNFNSIEVIKGPSGSVYGAGIGGVVNIRSKQPELERNTVSAGFTGGSYGLRRYTAAANVGDDQKAIRVSYADQQSEGYREHSAFDRKNLAINTVFNTGENSELQADILYTDLLYEIPGGLTQEEYEENPRQARPGNPFVLGSEEAGASIAVKNLLAGIGYKTALGSKGELHTTLYANIADFINPFNLDYKREGQQGYGGRTSANIYGNLGGSVDTKLSLGGEYQFRFAAARNYGNNSGQPDTLNFDDELRTKQYMLFGQYELFLPADWIITAGLSANNIQYDIHRLIDSEGPDNTRTKKDFAIEWMPRIALVKNFDQFALHGSISYGFSPPTLEEVRTNEGSINLDLDPEKGVNYEIGIRGSTLGKRFSYDVTAFYLRLQETIVDYTSDRGTDLFRNSGSTNQQGVEAAFDYLLVENPTSWITRWNINLNYAYHYFKFDEYIRGEEDFSANDFTGVAPHTIWAGMDITSAIGFYARVNYNYTDDIPLTDANDVYADSYHLVLAKLGYRKNIAENFTLDIFAGGDNLLNQNYSLGNDLNPFGGRYYQPAPDRNYYGGLSMRYQF